VGGDGEECVLLWLFGIEVGLFALFCGSGVDTFDDDG
jgi:hypothetical protein